MDDENAAFVEWKLGNGRTFSFLPSNPSILKLSPPPFPPHCLLIFSLIRFCPYSFSSPLLPPSLPLPLPAFPPIPPPHHYNRFSFPKLHFKNKQNWGTFTLIQCSTFPFHIVLIPSLSFGTPLKGPIKESIRMFPNEFGHCSLLSKQLLT
ncbi:hypothetical protein GPALN_003668 [Globodera pallida]|nr:hypothetical protein GPALN_003668 [Globodera pallida]